MASGDDVLGDGEWVDCRVGPVVACGRPGACDACGACDCLGKALGVPKEGCGGCLP